MEPKWQKAAEYAGLSVSSRQNEQMERYRQWLITEAVQAGGIGPNETHRVDERHLADSVLFASELDDHKSIWDLGSGVGLPGVPLAILLPNSEFVLIDRSGRRTDLLRRAIRIVDLGNCQVLQGEITTLDGVTDAIVSRASLPPDVMAPIIQRHLNEDGVAIVGGSWTSRPEYPGWSVKEIPSVVLDQAVWLLIMRRP